MTNSKLIVWVASSASLEQGRAMRSLCLAFFIAASFGCPALAQGQPGGGAATSTATDCDRLAASAYSKGLPAGVIGVAPDKIDAKAAIPACEAALKADPGNPRVMFQLGRAYNAGANYDAAFKQYSAAHAKGDLNATVNLAILYQNGRGITKDEAEGV